MATLSAEYDGRAVQAYIDQKFVGNGALIKQELEKSKAQFTARSKAQRWRRCRRR